MMIRLVDVDQTNMPEVHAEARYTPLTERARAVTAPKLSGSEKVETCDQSFREIVIMSVDRSQEQYLCGVSGRWTDHAPYSL